MKKVFKEGILSLIAVVIGVFLVKPTLAQDYGADYVSVFINWIKSTYGTFFAALFGHSITEEFLFTKVLLFIIIFAVVFMSLKRVEIFKKSRPILLIVSLCVSILSVRYLKETDIIRAILIPYGALGGAIAVFLPLLIFFVFLHTLDIGGFGRRAGWFIYFIIFVLLWGSSPYIGGANWIYIAGLVFIILSFIFDKSVHRYFVLGDFRNIRNQISKERAIDLIDKIKKARSAGADEYADDLEDKYNDLIRRANIS